VQLALDDRGGQGVEGHEVGEGAGRVGVLHHEGVHHAVARAQQVPHLPLVEHRRHLELAQVLVQHHGHRAPGSTRSDPLYFEKLRSQTTTPLHVS